MTIAGIGSGDAISVNTTTVRVGDAVTAKIASRRLASLGCLSFGLPICPLLAARMLSDVPVQPHPVASHLCFDGSPTVSNKMFEGS
jgi:hypothetical protein